MMTKWKEALSMRTERSRSLSLTYLKGMQFEWKFQTLSVDIGVDKDKKLYDLPDRDYFNSPVYVRLAIPHP